MCLKGESMRFSVKVGSGAVNENRKPWGLKGTIIGIVVAALLLAEMLVLRGSTVATGTIDVRDQKARVVIPVRQAGQRYLVEVSPNRKNVQLKFVVRDPRGNIEYEKSELSAGKGTRYISFTPRMAGDYSFGVDQSSLTFGGNPGYVRVKVLVNDRRILTPLLGKIL